MRSLEPGEKLVEATNVRVITRGGSFPKFLDQMSKFFNFATLKNLVAGVAVDVA